MTYIYDIIRSKKIEEPTRDSGRQHNWSIPYSVTKIKKVTSNILPDFVPKRKIAFTLVSSSVHSVK